MALSHEPPRLPMPAHQPIRLHVSDDVSPDLHLLDASGSCSLHASCDFEDPGASSAPGIRAVVAFENGVGITGLAEDLAENDVCFALGTPLKLAEIRGHAAALSFDARLVTPAPQSMPRGLVPVTGQPFSSYLTGLIGQVIGSPDHLSLSATRAIARALLSSLSSIFIEESARANLAISRSRSDDLYLLAVTTIRAQLAKAELSPADIAQTCAVSPRYLHMLFQKHGETVSSRILHERLERCRADLIDPALEETSISEIAARWGFNTPSHFAQKFRLMYGLTPREWRAQSLTTS